MDEHEKVSKSEDKIEINLKILQKESDFFWFEIGYLAGKNINNVNETSRDIFEIVYNKLKGKRCQKH